jgi:lipopolysaccharide export system protein LptA
MTLDVKLGTALLIGNARVIDDEWGEASGEQIILEKGKRMVKVIARENGRSRLELPPLPNLGFGKKSKKKIIK